MTGTLHVKYRGGGRAEFRVRDRAAAEALAQAILEAVVESARPAGFTFEDRRGHSSLEAFEEGRPELDDERFVDRVLDFLEKPGARPRRGR